MYDGTTSLSNAIALDLKLCSISNTNKISKLTQKAASALGLSVATKGGVKPPAYCLAVYEWLKENELNTTQSLNAIELIIELDSTQLVEPISELNIIQTIDDIAPTVEPVIELDTIHTQNDSKPCDKFISVNYRHADNSRHTVQIEQFYIDALIAIGITDISTFVAENAGLKSVTKNVKRSIVNELVKRAK
jgi:hypothetical protein